MKVIIAAAGTAGHINPGLAIANKIKEENKDSEIIFIGTTRGLENDLVPRSGYELKTIEAYGLSKKISIQTIKQNIKTLQGISQAKKIIKEFNPDIVIGTGGYICGAVIVSAKKIGIPTLIHESNAFPGKATKYLSKQVDKILVSFEEAKEQIKYKEKVVYTGTPVKMKKKEYTLEEKQKVLYKNGLKLNMPTVLIFGGSQGARNINKAIIDIIEIQKKNECEYKYQMIWAAGPKQYDIVKDELEGKGINVDACANIKVVPYIYEMEELMNSVDLIVARSGAMTVSEISILGKPSILIPLPNVSNDHQLYNAKALEKVGGAVILQDKELNAEKLNDEIEKIVSTKEKIESMGKNALKIAPINAIEKIYKQVKEIQKRS